MKPQSSSRERSGSTQKQLTLPECSVAKTRRGRGRHAQIKLSNTATVIQGIPGDVKAILKSIARKRKITYTALCRAVLTDFAYMAMNPGRRR